MTDHESNNTESSHQVLPMKKHLCLYGFALTLLATTGCSTATNEMIVPDADFYAKGLEAEKNGAPPGSSPGKGSKVKPSNGPSAISP